MKDDGDIPDLLLPGRARPEPARPEPARPSAAGLEAARPRELVVVDVPADPNDLEFDLSSARGEDLPWDSPFRPSEAPEVAQPTRVAPVSAPSVRPGAGPSIRPAPAQSVRPPALDLGLDSTVWDFDDELDPAAAQMNVALAAPAKDELPWPAARTPQAEDLNFSKEDIETAFGVAPPAGFLGAPGYYWSARRALGRLARDTAQQASRLAEAEGVRDRLLADMAQGARANLEGTDRFRAPYDRVDQATRTAEAARTALAGADARGESGLSQIDVELETAKATAALRTRDAAERRGLSTGGERDLARLRAAVQRHSIERRNIVARAQETSAPGAEMPPELAGRFLAVEEQIKRGDTELGAAQAAQKRLDAQLRAAEDEERRALAHIRQIEAKREGLILAQQGTLGEMNEGLERAEAALVAALAEVGLGIVELRGEVPVDGAVRKQLLTADEAVSSCALDLERLRRASDSLDRPAYQQGRAVFIVMGVLLVALLAWLLSR